MLSIWRESELYVSATWRLALIDLDQLDRAISQDAPGGMTLADFEKRVVSYGKNSLVRPSRRLSPKESEAMFEIGEGVQL